MLEITGGPPEEYDDCGAGWAVRDSAPASLAHNCCPGWAVTDVSGPRLCCSWCKAPIPETLTFHARAVTLPAMV